MFIGMEEFRNSARFPVYVFDTSTSLAVAFCLSADELSGWWMTESCCAVAVAASAKAKNNRAAYVVVPCVSDEIFRRWPYFREPQRNVVIVHHAINARR